MKNGLEIDGAGNKYWYLDDKRLTEEEFNKKEKRCTTK